MSDTEVKTPLGEEDKKAGADIVAPNLQEAVNTTEGDNLTLDLGTISVRESSNFTIGPTYNNYYLTGSNQNNASNIHHRGPSRSIEETKNIVEKYHSARLVRKYEEAMLTAEEDFDVMSDGYMPIETVLKETDDQNQQSTNTESNQHISQQQNLLPTDLLEKLQEKKIPMVIEAEAGMGKTTLVRRVKTEWTKNESLRQYFPIALFIPLRRVKHDKIADIICKDLALLPESELEVFEKYLEFFSENILFLVDGMDEAKLADDSEISKLLFESKIHLLLTTRPVATAHVQILSKIKYIHVRMNGFSQDVLQSYICKNLNNNEQEAVLLQDECKKHLFSQTLLRVPLYAYLMCDLWNNDRKVFSDTATQLFNTFLKLILSNYLERQGVHFSIEFNKSPLEKTVPKEVRQMLLHVARLAHTTLSDGKLFFTEDDLSDHCLDVSDIQRLGLFCVEPGKDMLIYFRHKLFHEYFMGLYLSISEGERFFLVTSHFEAIVLKNHISQHALLFAAGLNVEAFANLIDIFPKHRFRCSSQTIFSLMFDLLVSQLLFENQDSCEISQNIIENSIVVNTGFAHSVATALFMVERKKRQQKEDEEVRTNIVSANWYYESKSREFSWLCYVSNALVIIGNEDYSRHELQRILAKTRENDCIEALLLQNPNLVLFDEIFAEAWPHIVMFYIDCDVLKLKECPNMKDILHYFPEVTSICLPCLLAPTKAYSVQNKERSTFTTNVHVCFGESDRHRKGCPLYIKRDRNILDLEVVTSNPEGNCDFISGVEDNIQSICFHEKRSSRWPIKEMLMKCPNLASICIPLLEILYDRSLIDKVPKSVETFFIKCKVEDFTRFEQFGELLWHSPVFSHIRSVIIAHPRYKDIVVKKEIGIDPVVWFISFIKSLIVFETALSQVSFETDYHMTHEDVTLLEDFNSSNASWSIKVSHTTMMDFEPPVFHTPNDIYNQCCRHHTSSYKMLQMYHPYTDRYTSDLWLVCEKVVDPSQ